MPFVAIDEWLRKHGFSAPVIVAQDLEEGILLIEDLGSEGLLDAEGVPIAQRYELAIECLAALHRKQPPESIEVDGRQHHVPAYDPRAMQIEIELLTDWYLPWKRGTSASEAERRAYVAMVLAQNTEFVLLDEPDKHQTLIQQKQKY